MNFYFACNSRYRKELLNMCAFIRRFLTKCLLFITNEKKIRITAKYPNDQNEVFKNMYISFLTFCC